MFRLTCESYVAKCPICTNQQNSNQNSNSSLFCCNRYLQRHRQGQQQNQGQNVGAMTAEPCNVWCVCTHEGSHLGPYILFGLGLVLICIRLIKVHRSCITTEEEMSNLTKNIRNDAKHIVQQSDNRLVVRNKYFHVRKHEL